MLYVLFTLCTDCWRVYVTPNKFRDPVDGCWRGARVSQVCVYVIARSRGQRTELQFHEPVRFISRASRTDSDFTTRRTALNPLSCVTTPKYNKLATPPSSGDVRFSDGRDQVALLRLVTRGYRQCCCRCRSPSLVQPFKQHKKEKSLASATLFLNYSVI